MCSIFCLSEFGNYLTKQILFSNKPSYYLPNNTFNFYHYLIKLNKFVKTL